MTSTTQGGGRLLLVSTKAQENTQDCLVFLLLMETEHSTMPSIRDRSILFSRTLGMRVFDSCLHPILVLRKPLCCDGFKAFAQSYFIIHPGLSLCLTLEIDRTNLCIEINARYNYTNHKQNCILWRQDSEESMHNWVKDKKGCFKSSSFCSHLLLFFLFFVFFLYNFISAAKPDDACMKFFRPDR